MWRFVPNLENSYQVNEEGQVKRLERFVDKKDGVRQLLKESILKIHFCNKGYAYVTIRLNKVKKNLYVHRLVAEAFVDNPLKKEEVNHIDGNKSNFSLGNLEWVTKKENAQHAAKLELWDKWGEKCNFNKLREEEVIAIFGARHTSSKKEIAEKFQIHQNTVHLIWKRKIWKRLLAQFSGVE